MTREESLKFRIACLEHDLAHERSEKYAAQHERLVLRAYVDRLREAILNNTGAGGGRRCNCAHCECLRCALDAVPEQSLAEHYAEVGRRTIADATQEVHLVFTTIGGEQGHMEHLVFVESEDKNGRSIKLGDMTRRDDGLYELVIQIVR